MHEIRTVTELIEVLKKGYIVKDGIIQRPPFLRVPTQLSKEDQHFCISLADHVLAVDCNHSEIYNICKDYLTDRTPEFHINISDDDLAFERAEAERTNSTFSSSYLETLALYRKICELMLTFDTFLMHGAVVAVGDNAYMFTADSGTGKTTHIMKWIEQAKGAYVVNGDKPLIHISGKRAMASGTPWCGKEHLGTNVTVPLDAIILMERCDVNRIERISFSEAYPLLLQQTYRPQDVSKMRKTLSLLSRLNGSVRFFRFYCNNYKDDCFITSYKALTDQA